MQFTQSDYGYHARSAEDLKTPSGRTVTDVTARSYYIDRPRTLQPAGARHLWGVRIFRYDVRGADTQDYDFRTKKEAVAYIETYEEQVAKGTDHWTAMRCAFDAAMDIRYPEVD